MIPLWTSATVRSLKQVMYTMQVRRAVGMVMSRACMSSTAFSQGRTRNSSPTAMMGKKAIFSHRVSWTAKPVSRRNSPPSTGMRGPRAVMGSIGRTRMVTMLSR